MLLYTSNWLVAVVGRMLPRQCLGGWGCGGGGGYKHY